MNKSMIDAVSALVLHVVSQNILPKIVASPVEDGYKKHLLDFYKGLDKEKADFVARAALSTVSKSFMGVPAYDLDDVIATVISSTIQSEDNDYDKAKKSTYGFWARGYDVFQSPANFKKAFCHVFYKAVQSQVRNLETLKKHEVINSRFTPPFNGQDEFNYIETVLDDRDTEGVYETLSEFETCVSNFRNTMLARKDFDEIDKRLFDLWFQEKDRVDFTSPVRMSSTVYPMLIKQLQAEGKKISSSTLHYRWTKIKDIMSVVLKQI